MTLATSLASFPTLIGLPRSWVKRLGFSNRVEYAGQFVADKAIQAHRAAGTPLYFIDSKDRLVKQTSDGRRFEVRVNQDG
jgi:hypothetical protein